MNKTIFLILIIILIIFFNNKKENFSNYFTNLKNNWNNIFPDGNRNAGGPRFFNHIINMKNLSYKDFLEYNKLYCAVSGSFGHKPTADFIKLKEVDTNNIICGKYYRCCWPCSCDLMKYARVIKMEHEFTDGIKDFYAIVINNPCSKKEFPKFVNRNYFCENDKLNKNKIKTINDLLIFGILHDTKICSTQDIIDIDKNKITGELCNMRNSTPIEKLNYGMGDIFIKLAL